MSFLPWWKVFNAALAERGETPALWEEARGWWEWRAIKKVDERLINRVINARKPI